MRIAKLAMIPVLAATFAIGACDVDKTEEGNLPDVDVQGGNLPEYDVDAPDVNVTTDTTQVVTPDIDIDPAN